MIYHVFANRSNIGDWLSAKGIQKLLGTNEITECLCDTPFVDETIDRLSQATEKDLIVIGGGGLLMDYFEPFWKGFLPISERVPFCIWGIGCCDLKNEDSLPPRRLIEEIVNRSELCVVRDDLTRSFLINCDIAEPVACPSMNMIAPVFSKGENITHVVNYTTVGASAYKKMRRAARDLAESYHVDYLETNNLIPKGSEERLKEVLGVYEKSKIIVSSALHGCVIGVAMGLAVLAVSGDRKIDSFMRSVELDGWVIEAGHVGEKLLRDRLIELESQVNPVELVRGIRESNIDVATEVVRIARSVS